VVAAILAFALIGHLSVGYPDRLDTRVTDATSFYEKLHAEAIANNRYGKCHFKAQALGQSVEDFLESWNCSYTASDLPRHLPVAVFGNSHGAGIAGSFYLQKIGVTHLTGAACPSIDTEGEVAYCRTLRAFQHAFLQKVPHKALLLADLSMPTEAYLKKIYDTWHVPGMQIFLLGLRPYFHDHPARSIRQLLWRDAPTPPKADISSITQFQRMYNEREDDYPIQMIEITALLCQKGDCGDLNLLTTPYYTDYSHLSILGMQHIGPVLVNILTERGIQPVQ